MTLCVSFDWSAGIANDTEEMHMGKDQWSDLSGWKDWDELFLYEVWLRTCCSSGIGMS